MNKVEIKEVSSGIYLVMESTVAGYSKGKYVNADAVIYLLNTNGIKVWISDHQNNTVFKKVVTQNIHKVQVFDSYSWFPNTWSECLTEAQNQGYTYIDFNGMVFHAIPQSPQFNNAICLREDLIQG